MRNITIMKDGDIVKCKNDSHLMGGELTKGKLYQILDIGKMCGRTNVFIKNDSKEKYWYFAHRFIRIDNKLAGR